MVIYERLLIGAEWCFQRWTRCLWSDLIKAIQLKLLNLSWLKCTKITQDRSHLRHTPQVVEYLLIWIKMSKLTPRRCSGQPIILRTRTVTMDCDSNSDKLRWEANSGERRYLLPAVLPKSDISSIFLRIRWILGLDTKSDMWNRICEMENWMQNQTD